MAIATSQQINNYYDQYRDTEVTFTKDIIKTLALDPRQIYVKCNGAQWPCIINSASLQCARIILGIKGGAFAQITKKNAPAISLRFCFFDSEKKDLLSFFVASKITNITPYMSSKELAVITLTYTQRPPDDLVFKLGSLLEANTNAIRRKEERIVLTDASIRKLNISKIETYVYVQDVPRRCLLKNLSFCGAKIILLGLSKYLNEKTVTLNIEFEDPHEIINIKGRIVATDFVENHKDIVFANINFDENLVPLAYKLRINDYITSVRKVQLTANQKLALLKKEQLKKHQQTKPEVATSENTDISDVSKTEESSEVYANTASQTPENKETHQTSNDINGDEI